MFIADFIENKDVHLLGGISMQFADRVEVFFLNAFFVPVVKVLYFGGSITQNNEGAMITA